MNNENINRCTIPSSRNEDILMRGEDMYVYNFRKEIVKLKNCDIWFNTYGDYYPPDEYIECNNLFNTIIRTTNNYLSYCLKKC